MLSKDKTDCELMSAVKFGNRQALGLIFDRHRENLIRIALNELSSVKGKRQLAEDCLLYTSPSPRDKRQSRMPSSA